MYKQNESRKRPPQTQCGMKNTTTMRYEKHGSNSGGQWLQVESGGGAWACTVLQAPEMHDGGAYFVLKIELRGHLTRVIEVDSGVACVAKEQGATGKFFAEAYLQPTECQ